MSRVDRDRDAAIKARELTALVRRVVAARIRDRDAVDDIVQETLARVIGARSRLDLAAVGPYAIVTARNLVTSQWRRADTARRHQHRLVDRGEGINGSDEPVLQREEAAALRAALERLSPREREVLVAHEVDGKGTLALADGSGSTPGAIAAQLSRSRAKLRVEYLLEVNGAPPTSRCRPVLLALSAGDRRRQAELDSGYHLLDCDFCAALGEELMERRPKGASSDVRVVVRTDSDVVTARRLGHGVALQAGLSPTEATVVATAVSEISRNIVRFARRGDVTFSIVSDGRSSGVTIVARDVGPGIADVELALQVGYTTYNGRGLGLPGSRKLMDEFEILSEVGMGTTVTMTKWRRG